MKKSIVAIAISMVVFAGSAFADRERDVNVTNDPTTQTHTRDVTGTTVTGKSYEVETSVQKMDDGRTRSISATGPNGKTVERSTTITHGK